MGDRIAILREGGVLAQYDTPDAILAHPADDFVAQFIGEDRALRRLALRTLARRRARAAGRRRPTRRRAPRHDDGPQRGLADARRRHRPRGRRRRRRTAPLGVLRLRRDRGAAVTTRSGPGHPELRPGQRLRHAATTRSAGTGCAALARHALARARPAHRADGDRRRDRLRDRVRARAARTPAHACSSSRSASSRRCSTRSRASRSSSCSSRSPASRGRPSRSRSSPTRS